MSILISAEDLLARRGVATGALAPLAAGLRAELEPLVAHPPEVPTLKADLSRAAGRCAYDGALLTYDPRTTTDVFTLLVARLVRRLASRPTEIRLVNERPLRQRSVVACDTIND
ncbi:MAG: hypothetical protein WKF55_03350 [Gemmatimonadaceae bacterium]